MFKHKEFFTSILPATGRVILGDGQTSIPINGVGTVRCYIGTNEVIIPNVRYVPDISESIYSLFLHIKLMNHRRLFLTISQYLRISCVPVWVFVA